MPRITLLAFAALFLPAAAAAIDAASRVDEVTVYPRGAIVTRVAAIEVPAATGTIRLPGLPDNLDPSPLRADVDRKPGVVLWRRAVEPGETWAIEHDYTTSFPAEGVLTRR